VNKEVYVNASHLVDSLIHHFYNSNKHLEEFHYENIDWPTDKETGEPVEVFEWWIVSSFMGRKLLEKEELIIKSGTLTIWGRTTTGQHITMDSVIEDIYDEIH
tara:strand:+ start:401 stop:709 length:309 start_codon:yes stop_codon:yes gene_type:complete